jgi:hypothetical protein
VVPAAAMLGRRSDDSEVFQLPESLGEECTRESGRSLQNLTKARTTNVQVANDQWCPALREYLSAPRDWAVLAVCPHDASVAFVSLAVKSRLLTLLPRIGAVR